MPNYRYRALTQNGEIVNGTLSAPTSAEVARRIEYLRLLPIETVEDKGARAASGGYGWFGRPSAAEITTFTRDLALLLKAGARLDAALGRPNEPKPPALALVRLSSTVSIGSSRKYSIRRVTSATVGAESVPFTISPFCVNAR